MIEIEVRGSRDEILKRLCSILKIRLYRINRETFSQGFLIRANRKSHFWKFNFLTIGFLILLTGSALAFGFGYRKRVHGKEGDLIPLPRSSKEVRIDAFSAEYHSGGELNEVRTILTLFESEAGREKSGESIKESPRPGSLFTKEIAPFDPLLVDGFRIRQGTMTEDLAKAYLLIRKGKREKRVLVNIDEEALVPFEKDLVYSIGEFSSENHEGGLPAIRIDLQKNGVENPPYWISLRDSVTAEGITIQFQGYLPHLFTEIFVERNPGFPFALLGGGIVFLGIFLSFLFPPHHVWIKIIPSRRKGMTKVFMGELRNHSKTGKKETEKILKILLLTQPLS
jgi:hypothetical protein